MFEDVLTFLAGRGFSIVALEQNGGDDESGQMLMIDGIFRPPRRSGRSSEEIPHLT